MGCHTWCYAHIPEKETLWEKELVKEIKRAAVKTIRAIHKMSQEELQTYADEDLERNKKWLNELQKAREKGDIKDFLVLFDDEEKLNKYAEKLPIESYTWQDFKNAWLEEHENILLADCSSDMEFILKYKNSLFIDNYGLFIIKDNKIYRDTCHYRGPGYGENYIFDKQFTDIFRIYDYEAEPCYSLEDTLRRCEEHNIDWNETYQYCDIKVNKIERIYEFWETYPDGIIEFG